MSGKTKGSGCAPVRRSRAQASARLLESLRRWLPMWAPITNPSTRSDKVCELILALPFVLPDNAAPRVATRLKLQLRDGTWSFFPRVLKASSIRFQNVICSKLSQVTSEIIPGNKSKHIPID